MTLWQAMSRRLRRNYGWMFLILLLAWALKISSAKLEAGAGQPDSAHPLWRVVDNATLGPLPGWLVLALVAGSYAVVLYASFQADKRAGELVYGNVHV
jgi:uncharacterized membrane protein